MKVALDYICEHGMPQPWATCTDCMLLPLAEQPVPPRPEPKPAKVVKKRAAPKKKAADKDGSPRTAKDPAPFVKLPRSADDPVPELAGDKDLAYEIPEKNLRYHAQGDDNSWLPISSLPRELRESGWIYLQVDRRLVAKCRVKGIGFREKRWSHESPESSSDSGPGPVLEIDGDAWEFMDFDLGPGGDKEIRGFRYLETEPDGSVSLTDD